MFITSQLAANFDEPFESQTLTSPESPGVTMCPPGYFVESGVGCEKCPPKEYTDQFNAATTCLECPTNSVSEDAGGSSVLSCSAQEGKYLDDTMREVFDCPDGSTCTTPGVTLRTLVPLPGHFRASETSLEFPRCRNAAYCPGADELNVTSSSSLYPASVFATTTG